MPVRAGRFIARRNWIVCGSDDFKLRVYNYNTSERVATFEAHPDYIRAIVVHPTQPFVLTASDDSTIKLWNWEKDWKCVQVFEGHGHYVMGLAINPKDTNTFASACLDRTVKIWSLGSGTANYTLEAHETKGVNHVDYYPQPDKPYLLTTSDDRTVKVWDYTTKSLIATLEGHTSNVSFACYHPELPVIISGAEDGTVKIWHANTYRLEQSINYNLERAWCVAYQRGKQGVGIGFDDGAVVVKMGREEPAASMDGSGKIVCARHNEVVSAVVKPSGTRTLVRMRRLDADMSPVDITAQDGSPLVLPFKELGTCEIYPQTLLHSPNGRFVSVCGDGEYILYTALAWRNKAYGSALDFAWGSKDNSNDYAIRESATSVRIYRNFKEKPGGLDVGFQAEGLSGGVLLGVKGQGGVGFFDWETGALVRRIEVEPRNVGTLAPSQPTDRVLISSLDRFTGPRVGSSCVSPAMTPFTSCVTPKRATPLRSRQARSRKMGSSLHLRSSPMSTRGEFGVRLKKLRRSDKMLSIRTGEWVGDCFIYTNSTNRLNYLVGDQTYTISHFDQPMYILKYLPRDGRIYLIDKDLAVVSFALSLAVVEYQTLVLRGEMEAAEEVLQTVPEDQKNRIARFLEGQGYKDMALAVATDPEHRFDLALALQQLDVAHEIARQANADHKWKTLGDAALAAWDFSLAEQCFLSARDLGSLLLLYTSTSNAAGLRQLTQKADEAAINNIAFTSLWQLGDVDACIDLLLRTNRTAEAVMFAQTYRPRRAAEVAKKWKAGLEKDGKAKLARSLGVPPNDDEEEGGGGDEDLFPEWDRYLELDKQRPAPKLVDVGTNEDGEDGQ